VADVRDRAALHDAVGQGVAEFGRMDIVVANAGVIMFHETSLDITEDLYDLVVDTCLKGAWNTIQVTAPVPVLPLQALKVLPDLDTDPDSAFRAGPAAAGSRDLQHCCVPGLWRRPLQHRRGAAGGRREHQQL
jgi:NAD(P)-dependent dehydrogenase (short-subunit alcohol dehydrogenase family)